MKRTLLAGLLVAMLTLGWGMAAMAEDKIVETDGASNVSRADAIRQAMRAAVEEGVGVFVKSETEVENFALVKDKVFSHTEGYVRGYDMLADQKIGDEFQVRIRATVSLDQIKNDLVAMKVLLEAMERPKLLVLVEEDYKSMDNLGMGIAGTEMTSLLAAKGFELVDKAQLETVLAKDQTRQALGGNDAAAAALGVNFGAQYVILGKAVAQDAGEAYPGSGLKSIQASLQLRVIQTQTAAVLGSVVKNAVSAHMSPLTGATNAFQDAARQAAEEYLVNAITNSFQDFLNNGAPIKLQVTGIKSFADYKAVAEAVETLPQVASSKREGWNKAGGIVALDLRFKGTSEELAMALDGRALGPRKLEVTDFAPQRVDCQLK